MVSRHSPTRIAKRFLSFALATALIPAPGCGENPGRMAGTIELPERKFSPPPTAKSFSNDKANPKNPNP